MASRRIFIVGLAVFVIIRVIMVMGMVRGIPQVEYHQGWFFHHGGDEEEYFRAALSLANFEPVESYRTLGFSLFLVPFIWIFQAHSIGDILIPVVIFNSCILFGASILLIGFLTEKLTQNRTVALIAAGLWLVHPYLLRLLFLLFDSRHAQISGVWMSHWMWLEVLSEPLSVFLVIATVCTFLVSLEKEGFRSVFLSGALLSAAFITRPENGILMVLFATIYLFKKQAGKAVLLLFAFLIFSLPQFFYNLHFFGSFSGFAVLGKEKEYLAEDGLIRLFSLANIPLLLGVLWHKLSKILFGFILCILGFAISGIVYLFKNQRLSAALLFLWIFLYAVVYACWTATYHQGMIWLHSMHIFPALVIVIAQLLVLVGHKF